MKKNITRENIKKIILKLIERLKTFFTAICKSVSIILPKVSTFCKNRMLKLLNALKSASEKVSCFFKILYEKLKNISENKFLKKHREAAAYILFGALTTIVNWVVYTILGICTQLNLTALNAVSWTVAVIFAFFTNKHFVFQHKTNKRDSLFLEIVLFFVTRALSGAVEIFLPAFLVSAGLNGRIFGIKGAVSKLIVSFLVIVLNYLFGKFIVFQKKLVKDCADKHDDLISIKRKTKLDNKVVLLIIVFVLICAFMTACNFLTDLCADDYGYFVSFATKRPIKSVSDIFPSMAAHAKSMNGRLIAHFFVQFFLLLPNWVFKVVNTSVFMLQLVLIFKIADISKKYGAAIFAAIFGMLWIYQPSFGQVNLWLDGSCNYLWSLVFGLAFLFPYVKLLVNQKEIECTALKIILVPLGFIAGAYLENASAAVVFAAVALIVLSIVFSKKRFSVFYYIAAVSSIGGFIFMMSAPAEHTNKSSKIEFDILRRNFVAATEVLKDFAALFVFFAVLLALSLLLGRSKNKIIAAAVFFTAAMCSNFVMTFASYYPERCAFAPVVFLTVANAILMSNLLDSNYRIWPLCISSVLIFITLYSNVIGLNDIYETHRLVTKNNEYIVECKDAGIYDIELPMIYPDTKYSAIKGLKYLDTNETRTWPNHSMAEYYGVDTIIGVK